MADDAQFLRAQAEKCRWLAQRINTKDVVESLLEMARDYEARAKKMDAGEPPSSPPPPA
jgi:hypothetical protein